MVELEIAPEFHELLIGFICFLWLGLAGAMIFQQKFLKFQNALSFSHHPGRTKTPLYLLITEASEHRTTISVMEEEEVEELEECETEELEELEESSPGVCNQSTGGAFGVSHFLLCFFC